MAIEHAQYRFSTADYFRMAELGVIPADARVELINGVILEMSPVGQRHRVCVDRLNAQFTPRLVGRAIVRVQAPVSLGDGQEPEPDLAILSYRDDFYSTVAETPADILLIVEVADSSLEYDRRTKAPLYARHGVPELWIADLTRELLLVYRDPSPLGYTSTQALRIDDQISPLAFPDFTLRVGTVFGR